LHRKAIQEARPVSKQFNVSIIITPLLIDSWHLNQQKFVIYEKIYYVILFILFLCFIKNRANSFKQSAAASKKLFRMRLKKINVFHRIIKKNQNKNFVRKKNHEYFSGSDVTNVSYNQKK
jgi:hypothetical protein